MAAMPSAKPKSHRFRFRLRTLLIGVALLAIPGAYVGDEAKIVAARKTWIATHVVVVTTWNNPARGFLPTDEHDGPSILRRLLGDEDYFDVIVLSPGELPEAQKLFPEASQITVAANGVY